MRRTTELAKGLATLGFVGLLVGGFVVPSQWLDGSIRPEAKVGLAASLVCMLLAGLIARSYVLVAQSVLESLLIVSLGYLAVTPFVVSDTGVTVGLGLWVVGLSATALACALGLWLIKRRAVRKGIADERPKMISG